MEVLIRTPAVCAFSLPISTPSCRFLSSQVKWRDTVGSPCKRLVSGQKLTLIRSSSIGDLQRCRSNLETLFCYDKSIPEENIEKPVGLSLKEKDIGNNPPCFGCETKGAVLCATCSGSGLYVDAILESQGIIVKVVEALETLCVQNAEEEDMSESILSVFLPFHCGRFRQSVEPTGKNKFA